MAKPSIAYPLKVYDTKLWLRIVNSAWQKNNSINMEIQEALLKVYPEPKKKPENK